MLFAGTLPPPKSLEGEIGFQRTASGTTAHARYRDWNDRTRLLRATGATEKGAERALKATLAGRRPFQLSSSVLTEAVP